MGHFNLNRAPSLNRVSRHSQDVGDSAGDQEDFSDTPEITEAELSGLATRKGRCLQFQCPSRCFRL